MQLAESPVVHLPAVSETARRNHSPTTLQRLDAEAELRDVFLLCIVPKVVTSGTGFAFTRYDIADRRRDYLSMCFGWHLTKNQPYGT
jgi:hypothetical protein